MWEILVVHLNRKVVSLSATLLLCTGCDVVKSRFGLGHVGPDEFRVIPLAPLSVPGSCTQPKLEQPAEILLSIDENTTASPKTVPAEAQAADVQAAHLQLQHLIQEAEKKSQTLTAQVAEAEAKLAKMQLIQQEKEREIEQKAKQEAERLKNLKAALEAEQKAMQISLQEAKPQKKLVAARKGDQKFLKEADQKVDSAFTPKAEQMSAHQENSSMQLPAAYPNKTLTPEELDEQNFEARREKARQEEMAREAELLDLANSLAKKKRKGVSTKISMGNMIPGWRFVPTNRPSEFQQSTGAVDGRERTQPVETDLPEIRIERVDTPARVPVSAPVLPPQELGRPEKLLVNPSVKSPATVKSPQKSSRKRRRSRISLMKKRPIIVHRGSK
jgi:hypothetical protein